MPTLIVELAPRVGATGLLGQTLREYGHRARAIRLAPATGGADPVPSDLDDIDAIVLSDGPHLLTKDVPTFVAPLSGLLRDAHAQQIPTVGLGFGSRLLAQALGGEIVARPEVGWQHLTLTASGREEPLYKGFPWYSEQCFCQPEVIGKLPDGASACGFVRGASGTSSVASFTAGVFTFGFEHRFELDAETFSDTLVSHRTLLDRTPGGVDALRQGWMTAEASAMRLGRRMAESIALYLMPLDRLHSGRVKDLHY